MNTTFTPIKRILGSALLTLAGSILMTGCAFNGSTATTIASSTGGSSAQTKGLGGILHGGQQPIDGATVILWAAGAPTSGGGYGTGATNLASTITNSAGGFSFGASSPCTTGQYLYITATGGNAGAGTNNAIALMAAIPNPCSATTSSTTVYIDEVTTIAAVTALQQFMSINTGATAPYTGTGIVPWTIGAPSTNTTGLANAFLQTANLASISNGTSAAQTVTTTISSVAYSNVITPDFNKVDGLANILALCINSGVSGFITSGNLSNDYCNGAGTGVLYETIQTSQAYTSGTPGTATTIAPVDTIQAAYNMATLPNPSLYSGSANASATASGSYSFKYWNYSTSSTTYLTTLWNEIPSQAAFQPYGATAPADTAIDVGWKVNAGAYSQDPELAIDGKGNVWYAYYNTTTTYPASIAAYNQSGQMLFTPITNTTIVGGWDFSVYTGTTTVPLGTARHNGLAIDTNNNAWYAGFETANVTNTGNTTGNASGTFQAPLAEIVLTGTSVPYTAASNGYLGGESVGDVTIDGSNNVFFNTIPNFYTGGTARYYYAELQAAGTPAYSNFYSGEGRQSSNYFLGAAIDNTGLVWALENACAGTTYRTNNAIAVAGGEYPTTAALDGANTVTLSSTSPITCVTNGAVDASNNLWGTAGYLEYVVAGTPNTATPPVYATPTVTNFPTGTGITFGGLDTAAGVAIDGLGNVWVANNVSTTTGGLSEFAVSPTATAGVPALTPLSPAGSGSSPIYGFGSAYGWGNPFQPRIDSSGNVFMENYGNSSIFYLVGVAAPVVTPTALAVKNGTLATRP